MYRFSGCIRPTHFPGGEKHQALGSSNLHHGFYRTAANSPGGYSRFCRRCCLHIVAKITLHGGEKQNTPPLVPHIPRSPHIPISPSVQQRHDRKLSRATIVRKPPDIIFSAPLGVSRRTSVTAVCVFNTECWTVCCCCTPLTQQYSQSAAACCCTPAQALV